MLEKKIYKASVVKRTNVVDVLFYVVLAVLVFISVMPFYSMFISSTHENAVLNSSFQLVPGNHLLKNYDRMSKMVNVWQGVGNSLTIASLSTLLSVYFSGMTAYGFAKYKFKGRNILFWVLLATMMLPAQLGIIGVFQLMSTLKLLDNLAALIIPSIANASAVFFIRQYIQGYFPDSLMESGRIDGCGEMHIYHRIALPIIAPALATQAIFIFVGSWNNFISPLILLFSQDKFPMPLLIQQMQGIYGQDFGVIYLGVSISVIPILCIFAICSRWILGGLSVGAIKG